MTCVQVKQARPRQMSDYLLQMSGIIVYGAIECKLPVRGILIRSFAIAGANRMGYAPLGKDPPLFRLEVA
jgi:hypothetical protein